MLGSRGRREGRAALRREGFALSQDLNINLRPDVPNGGEPPDGRPLWRRALDWIVDVVRSWGPALLIVLVIRSIVVEPFQIPSGSMVPTLAIGDFILVSKFSYGVRLPFTDVELIPLGEPVRGDIIVFIWPGDGKTDYIKRIVGMPGDTVEVRDDVVYINGRQMPRQTDGTHLYTDNFCRTEEMTQSEEDLEGVRHPVLQTTSYGRRMADYGPKVVPEGHYFMMGDNRDNSSDSRVWNFVPRKSIRGKALFVWLSFNGCEGAIPALGSVRWERIGTGIR